MAGGDPALEEASGIAAAQSIAGQAKPGDILASRAAADGAGARYEDVEGPADVVKIAI